MHFKETDLKGAFIIEPEKLTDDRGFFTRTWCEREMEDHGIMEKVVQANSSFNIKRGTLRGMHYQRSPFGEAKLVRCIKGAIYDVIVDLRQDSSTYKQWVGVELKEEEFKMLFIPKNFAHGFVTLEDSTEVTYLMTGFYTPGYDAGYRWDDPVFNIKWPLIPDIISEKDKNLPFFPG